jgi:cation-transporting P-type ATPase 13A2
VAMNSVENKILNKILRKARIYARMSSEEKYHLIKKLRGKDKVVGMWGDGANDCKALKTADIGLSLSEAEASVAAPFTSTVQDISPIMHLLKEGKTSLWITFQLFKMIFLWAVIQSSGVFIMYYLNSDYTDIQFLYIDIVILFPIWFFMGVTKPTKRLTHHIPVGSLLSPPILLSIFGQWVIHTLFLFIILWILNQQDWYFPIVIDTDDDILVSYENSSLFLLSNIQYLSTLFAYNIAKPFMSPIYTNIALSVWVLFSFVASYYIIIAPSDEVIVLLDLAYLPKEFRYELALTTVVNFLLSYLFEIVLVKAFSEYWSKRNTHQKGYI